MNVRTLIATVSAVLLSIVAGQTSAYACSYEYWGNGVSYERCDDGSYTGNYRGW